MATTATREKKYLHLDNLYDIPQTQLLEISCVAVFYRCDEKIGGNYMFNQLCCFHPLEYAETDFLSSFISIFVTEVLLHSEIRPPTFAPDSPLLLPLYKKQGGNHCYSKYFSFCKNKQMERLIDDIVLGCYAASDSLYVKWRLPFVSACIKANIHLMMLYFCQNNYNTFDESQIYNDTLDLIDCMSRDVATKSAPGIAQITQFLTRLRNPF